MARALIVAAVFGLLAGCGPRDGGADLGPAAAGPDLSCPYPDYTRLCPMPMPDASAPDAAVPAVPCTGDAGPWSGPVCSVWVDCVFDGTYYWAASYSGTCGTSGDCEFSGSPTWTWCQAGCFSGANGRCYRVGSTVP